MGLTLRVDGASAEALARGLAAAEAVIDTARLTSAEAAMAHWLRARWHRSAMKGQPPPPGILEAATAFERAEAAAISACCVDGRAAAGCLFLNDARRQRRQSFSVVARRRTRCVGWPSVGRPSEMAKPSFLADSNSLTVSYRRFVRTMR